MRLWREAVGGRPRAREGQGARRPVPGRPALHSIYYILEHGSVLFQTPHADMCVHACKRSDHIFCGLGKSLPYMHVLTSHAKPGSRVADSRPTWPDCGVRHRTGQTRDRAPRAPDPSVRPSPSVPHQRAELDGHAYVRRAQLALDAASAPSYASQPPPAQAWSTHVCGAQIAAPAQMASSGMFLWSGSLALGCEILDRAECARERARQGASR